MSKKYQSLFSIFVTSCFFISTIYAGTILNEQEFEYNLEMSKDQDLCSHMLNVYNKNFRYPWKSEPFYSSSLPKSYNLPTLHKDAPKYIWPILQIHDKKGGIFSVYNNIALQERISHARRLSKFPTSKEFDSIKWKDSTNSLFHERHVSR